MELKIISELLCYLNNFKICDVTVGKGTGRLTNVNSFDKLGGGVNKLWNFVWRILWMPPSLYNRQTSTCIWLFHISNLILLFRKVFLGCKRMKTLRILRTRPLEPVSVIARSRSHITHSPTTPLVRNIQNFRLILFYFWLYIGFAEP